MKKIITTFVAIFLVLASVSVASASPSIETDKINKYLNEFKTYKDQLTVTEEEPYKEVQLPDGTILFNEIKITKGENQSAKNSIQATSSNAMTSSQGMKNAFGYVLYKLDYTTAWSFDYDKVTSSSSYIAIDNGLGWSSKGTNSYGPTVNDGGREHQWTGTAYFAMIVGGIDISNETLLNHHRVKFDGTYSWKYEVTD
ncbi:MAG TPA: hypothetical protein VGI33_14200 [Paenibacillus sp.]|jgi:hypothetical protein